MDQTITSCIRFCFLVTLALLATACDALGDITTTSTPTPTPTPLPTVTPTPLPATALFGQELPSTAIIESLLVSRSYGPNFNQRYGLSLPDTSRSLSEPVERVRDSADDTRVFSMYVIFGDRTRGEVIVYLARYSGFLESEAASATLRTLEFIEGKAPESLDYVTRLFNWQDRNGNVSLVELTFPMRVKPVEGAFAFAGESLSVIPDYYLEAQPLSLQLLLPQSWGSWAKLGRYTLPILHDPFHRRSRFSEYHRTGSRFYEYHRTRDVGSVEDLEDPIAFTKSILWVYDDPTVSNTSGPMDRDRLFVNGIPNRVAIGENLQSLPPIHLISDGSLALDRVFYNTDYLFPEVALAYYVIDVDYDNTWATATVYLTKYRGPLRSQAVEATAELLELARDSHPQSLAFLSRLVGGPKWVGLEFKIPLAIVEVEPKSYIFSRFSLELVPNFFPEAIHRSVELYIDNATKLGTRQEGLTVPVDFLKSPSVKYAAVKKFVLFDLNEFVGSSRGTLDPRDIANHLEVKERFIVLAAPVYFLQHLVWVD